MYLSRVEIDLQNRQKIKNLSHVGAYHHWVEESFPQEFENGERTRKLWRIDTLNHKQFLLIVSPTKPDLIKLERYGVTGSAQTKLYTTFLNSLKKGMQARFRVTLNPVVSIANPNGKRGRVVPHVTATQQMDFLLKRSEKNGFILQENDYSIVERGYVLLKRMNTKNIRLSKVVYEGKLTVRDSKQFKKTLTQGFGREKAYGFGMMTVIPE